MKKIVVALVALGMTLSMWAQEPKGNTVALCPIVEEASEEFPETAKQHLKSKLNSLLTQSGIASLDYVGQFFITATAVPLTKDIIGSAPTQIAKTMEVTFYIADYWNQKVFATTQLNVKGVGTTEAKAYIDALKHINVTSQKMKDFVASGKAKIIAYYDEQGESMLAKAKSLAAQQQYEEAFYILACIPVECKYYNAALALGDEVFKMYYDRECQKNLAAAKAAWAAQQNAAGAEQAGLYLAEILPDAGCYGDAEVLYAEIKAKVLDDWHFEMKKYQDTVDIQKEQIGAWRDVGVAYGQNQQPVTTNIAWLNR